MAHELTITADGTAEMMYVGEKPWHGLGQALDHPATSAEAMMEAKMGWKVLEKPIQTMDGLALPSHKALLREDNNFPLGIMGIDYKPVQNLESFAFLDSVIGTGEACYETAGSLFGGKKIFLVAKLPDTIRVHDDITEQYLTLVNSHDGMTALTMFFTPIRVVCNNTLTSALHGLKKGQTEKGRQYAIRLKHTGNIANRISAAQESLGMARRYFKDFQAIASALAEKQMDSIMVDDFLKEVFAPKKEDGEPKLSMRTLHVMNKVRDLFESDEKNNLPGIKGTAWALYSAATQYADHETVAVKRAADGRFASIFFGPSAQIKQKAMDAAFALI